MGYPKRDTRSNGRSGGKFKDRSNGRPDMFSAICAECSNSCQVPFKPNGSKPIYCSNCFEGKESSAPRRSGGRDFGGDREMFKTTCDDCGDSCQVPFKPTNGKKVFCSPCFDKGGDSSGFKKTKRSGGDPATARQLEQINRKLDILVDLLKDG